MERPQFDVFLSHMSGDKPQVEALARLLKNRGLEPWLDKWNLIPGEPWQEAIEKALDASTACAVCLGPSGIGPWQNEEMRAAIASRVSREQRRMRVIPVLLPGAELLRKDGLPPFLKASTWVEFRNTIEDGEALRRLICGIGGIAPGPAPGEAVAEDAQPYRGLSVFEVDDARFFFGRETLTHEALAKLSRGRLLAVIGPSGSGKSSLARAGVLAALKRGEFPGSESWPVVVLKPGPQPLDRLGEQLGESRADALKLTEDLAADEKVLHRATGFALRNAPADRRFVILVDQFEEVFTLCPEEAARRAFIDNLLYAAKVTEGKTIVLLTLRADFYGRCAAYRGLAEVLPNSQILVGPMSQEELRLAIEGPAQLAGLELQPGLVDLLLKEVVDEPGSLPLLEDAMLQIWQRRESRRLTVEAYREIRGVAGAIEQHAEEIVSHFTEIEREACRRIFLRLVQVDETRGATKRRLDLEELLSPSDPSEVRHVTEGVMAQLTKERLLFTEAAGEEKRPTVEVVHEVLFTAWERLADWIEAGRADLLIRLQLLEATGLWRDHGYDPSYLHGGARLAQAEEWAESHPGEVSQDTRAFLAASVARRDRQRRRTMILLSSVSITMLLAAGAMAWLWRASQQQQQINLATQMVGQARLNLASDSLVSLLLATESVRLSGDLPGAKGALLAALARFDAQPLGNPGIAAIAASMDGRSLVTTTPDGTATLREFGIGLPRTLRTFQIDKNVDKLALSNDRRWLLVQDRDGMVRLRNLEEQSHPAARPDELFPPGEPFSPDSRWLITRRGDTPVIRALQGAPAMRQIQGVPSWGSTAYSPDSRRLAVTLQGGVVELWDLPSGRHKTLPGRRADFAALAFSRNGLWLAAAILNDQDENVRVWRLDSGGGAGEAISLAGCAGNTRIALSPEGARVFTWGGQSAISCSWTLDNVDSGKLEKLPEALEAAFSDDGRWLAWSDWKGALHLQSRNRFRLELPAQGQPVRRLFFSPGSRWLVTHVGDESPRLWDLDRYFPGPILAATPEGERQMVGRPGRDVSVLAPGRRHQALEGTATSEGIWAISADGSRLAATGGGNTFLLWNLADANPAPLTVTLPESTIITSLAFSSTGDRLAVGSSGYAWLWDLHRRQDPQLLSRDPQRRAAFALAFDSSASRLAIGWSDGRVRIFQLSDPELPLLDAPPARDTKRITALAFSPSGKWMAMADANKNTWLWRPGQVKPLEGQESSFILAFSQDGRWLAGGSLDGTLQLWDLAAGGGIPAVWRGHEGLVVSLFFTKDGTELVSIGSNDTIRRWPLNPGSLLRLACEKAGRNLTSGEWKTHVPPGVPFREGTPCGQFGRK